MSTETDIVIPFHQNKNFEEDCIDLLNSEWPRSRVARVRSLEKSCDELPVALLLLLQIDEISPTSPTLVGHACLCSIPGRPNDCWVQTVVVDERLRGRGYGKRLMLATEKYAKEKCGIEIMYLSTHDKQAFYERLGYELCEPIFNVGANAKLLNDERFRKFTESITNPGSATSGKNIPESEKATASVAAPAPPPPPPPMPSVPNGLKDPEVVFMKKKLV